MKLFKQLHMSRIVLLAGVQRVLLPFKESINLFCLLHIFEHLDVVAMFMFLISLCARQYMIVVEKVLWLGMEE